MPPNTVKVDRSSRHGNPFRVGDNPSQFSTALPSTCDTIEESISCFRYYAESWVTITGGRWIDPLRGKNLACWCALGAPCHADVLLELANAPAQAIEAGTAETLGSVHESAVPTGCAPKGSVEYRRRELETR